MTGKPMRLASAMACVGVVEDAAAREQRQAERSAFSRAVTLSPQARIASGVGPMKVTLHFAQSSRELGVLGEEAVAGVDRVGAGDLGRADDRRDVEVALGAPAAGPMHTASSAKRTWSARASASECTATVSMPSSRHARMMRSAISPRLAMRIFLNKRCLPQARASGLLDAEELLPELHGLAVLGEDLDDGARAARPRSRSSASSLR